ncbi:MAG: class I SAM-dependent methyltransferase [Caldisericia bacterium]|nr:class I SAM-dependent methyltransferase [Caldisericia bacterium]
MIEVGCMNGRNLEIANELKIKYLGIDIVERFVKEANKKIDTLNLDAIAIRCDAKCLNKIKNHFSKHFLAIFPFNSFGNIQDPQKVLNSTYKNKLDTLILTYKTDIKTTKIRKKYLENTLFEKIKKRSSKKGVLFTSNKGLFSYAYSAEEIIKMGKVAGYKKTKNINFSKIGKGYLLLKE